MSSAHSQGNRELRDSSGLSAIFRRKRALTDPISPGWRLNLAHFFDQVGERSRKLKVRDCPGAFRMRVSQIIGLLRSALSADETRSTEHDSARCLLSWQSSNLAAADSSSLDIWRQPDNLAAAKHENPDSDNVCPKIWNAPFRMGVSRNSGVPLSLFCLPARPAAGEPPAIPGGTRKNLGCTWCQNGFSWVERPKMGMNYTEC